MAELIRANDLITIVELEQVPLAGEPDSEQRGWIEQTYQRVQSLCAQTVKVFQVDRALIRGGLAEKPLLPREYRRLEGDLPQRLISMRKARLSRAERDAAYQERRTKGSGEAVERMKSKLVYLINEPDSLAYGYAYVRHSNSFITLEDYAPLARLRCQPYHE